MGTVIFKMFNESQNFFDDFLRKSWKMLNKSRNFKINQPPWKAHQWEKAGRYWNNEEASESNFFWADVQRVFDPVEITDLKVNKKTKGGFLEKALPGPRKSWKCYVIKRSLEKQFSMIIVDSKNKLELKIDDLQGLYFVSRKLT